jgi:hypothetical protein
MADKLINLKINVKKIDASKLFKTEKGNLYLDATLLFNEAADQYGNNGMIVQQVSKEERLAGVKGAILGNAKIFSSGGKATEEDIPDYMKADGEAEKHHEPMPEALVKDDLPF